jgi:hypothetical protein
MSRAPKMALTPELVALVHRKVVDIGPTGPVTALTDPDYRR